MNKLCWIVLGLIVLVTLTGCSTPTKIVDSLVTAGCDIKSYNQRSQESIKITCYKTSGD